LPLPATTRISSPSLHDALPISRIDVDLSDRSLQLLVGDEVVAAYTVAVGKAHHATPTGDFQVRRPIWNPSWTPPDSEWARDKERSEEHTSELQSRENLVCRLLL